MEWHQACNRADLVEGRGRELLVAGRVIALFLSAGELFAVDGMCAHQGGPLAEGELHDNCLTCPWHGWQYDVRNGTHLLSGKRLLDTFEVEIRRDTVWICLPD